MVIRVLDQSLFSKNPHKTTRTLVCEEGDCENTTRENKPFCSKHVENIDYVRGILTALKDQQNEQERAVAQGTRAIKKDSLTLKEIIQTLSQKGEKTLCYLSRHLQLSEDVLKVYAHYLVKKRIARKHSTNRGSETLILVRKKQ